MELDATKFKDGDRVNHFLVNALRQLTAEERNILARNLLERSVVAPPHEDKGAEEEALMSELLIKHDSMPNKANFREEDIYKAMQEHASNERNRAIQECLDILKKKEIEADPIFKLAMMSLQYELSKLKT